MALDYNTSKIDKSDENITDTEWSEWFQTVCFTTMFVGINEITSDNYRTFAMRWAILNTSNGRHADVNLYLTVARKFVGLSTNASPMSEAEFSKRIRNNIIEWAKPKPPQI